MLNLSRLCFPSLCWLWINQRLHFIVSWKRKDENQQPDSFETPTIVPSIECKLCYKKFSKEAHLISHQKTLHTNATEFLHRELFLSDFQFNCTICKTKYVTQSLSRNHIMKHQNQKYALLRRECFALNTEMFTCKFCYSASQGKSGPFIEVINVFATRTRLVSCIPAGCFTPAGPSWVSRAGASSTTTWGRTAAAILGCCSISVAPVKPESAALCSLKSEKQIDLFYLTRSPHTLNFPHL